MKNGILVICLLTLLSGSFSYANSDLFYPYVTFSIGSWPEAVAIGDVNGDGRNDVVMTTSFYFDPENDYHIFVFLQNSSGKLNSPVKYPTNSSYSNRSESIDIGDVNHDGRADVVVGNCGSNIEIFIQDASGGLDPGVSYPTVNSCSIKNADLNNDGLLDVVGIGWGTNTVDILFQNQNGTLNPPVTYAVTHGGYEEVDVGDVNHDGLTDIIVMTGQGLSTNIAILYQQPNGSFSTPVYYDLGGNELTQAVAVGDINGDNLQDIVVTYGGNRPASKIGVFLQNGAGTLQPAVSYDSYDCPEPVVIADVNHDGEKDIIVAHGGWDALGVYLQGSNGTLVPEELYPVPYASHYKPQGLAVGDINGNGFNDVVLADYNSGLVVLYNIHGPAIPNIDVFPLSVNFGSVFLGNSGSRDITIYNRGTGTLTVSSIEITGPDAAAFGNTNSCSTVGPGSTCFVTLTFNTSTEGEKNATLTINSNDSDTPTVQVTLFAYAGQPLFHPYVNFPVGSWEEAVAIGDVNGDGRNDVVMTTSFGDDPENDYYLFVFLQNSSGQLNSPVKYPTNSSYSHRSVSIDIGDVNHDGRADVVVGNHGSNIEVFIQNASGGLDPGISYPTVNSCSIKIADLNNDGLLDVVGIGWGTNTVDILFQNQNGTLNPSVTYAVTHGGYDEVDVGDVNHDGLTDIIVMSGQSLPPNIGILYQQPDGSFSAPVYYDLGGNEFTHGVAVGDVNGDNVQDVVVTYGGNQPSSKIGVFLQNASGTLQPAVSYDSYDCPEPVVIADVNHDGKKDIIVAHGGWDALGVYLQGTNGTLMPEELYSVPYASHYRPHGLAVGDINGDGFNDVAIADYNNGLVVLYNTGCKAPSIVSQPQSQTIQSGQTATMSVSASGTVPLTYQWYQGSSGDTSNPIGGATSSRYTTPALNQTTSYWVKVTNSCEGADTNTAIVTVTPLAAPSISVSPVSHDFGNVAVGATSPPQTFSISNTGNRDLVIGTLEITGPDASQFMMQNDLCTGQTMGLASVCTVDVVFIPTAVGKKDVSLFIMSNDPDKPTVGVPLAGTGFWAPDLIETSVSNPPATALVGSRFSVTDTVKNQGDAASGAFTIRYYFSPDTIKGGGDILLTGSRSVPGLGDGKTSTGTVTVIIPPGTPAGNYYLLACADDTNAVIEKDENNNENNNCISSPNEVQVSAPDLIETSVTNPPATALTGSRFSVTDTAKNRGNAASRTSTTRYYLSQDTVKSSGDTLLTGSRSVPALAPGAPSTGTVTVTIPSTTPLGTYYLLACADDMNVVAESDESNNCIPSFTTVKVMAGPDLVEISVTNPPATASVGSGFSVTDTAKNQGNVTSGTSTTRYYLSLDKLKDGGDTLLTGSRSLGALAPGATSSAAVTVTVPLTTPLESYYLLACADDTSVVAEVDETNNCISSSSTVLVGVPDLIETSVSNPPATAKVGTRFSVTDTAKNKGIVTSGTSTTHYYLSLDKLKDAGDTLLTGSRSVPGLPPSGTSKGTVAVTIPSMTPPGTYYLLACSDDLNVVPENNETNNCIPSSTTVQVIP